MYRKLLSRVREYKTASLLTPLFVCLEVVLEVTIPLIMANLIDYGLYGNNGAGDMPYIIKTGAILLGAAVLSLVFGALAGHFSSVAGSGFAKNLRHDMFYNVQTFSFSNIDKFSASSIITRLTTDTTNVQMAFQTLIRMAMRSPAMLIISLIAAFSINARLASIFLCAVPVLGIGLYLIMSRVHPIFELVFKTYDRLNNVVEENVRGIRVVKAFVREEYEKKKFGDISESIFNKFTKAEKTLSFNGPLMNFCMYACTLLVSWLGARMIVSASGTDALTTGELTGIISYAMQILMSLMAFSMVFVMITVSRASMERIVEVLDEKSDIVNCDAPVNQLSDGSVEFCGVSFSYSRKADKPCLDNINLRIESGQTVGIIGGTGSSKSTLVQLIPRLYDADSGCVKVGGVDVRQYDIETLRDQVAMVLQKNVLFSGTVKDNLRWGNENATDEEIAHACKLAAADEFIEKFPDKYDTYIEQGGTNVSGGQKQRLCIARALLKKPKIIIMDDSTSAVDTKTDATIRRAFKEELPDTTKLIIAQRISSVSDADMIVVMEDGKIAAAGTHEQLLEGSEVYREVYNSQTKGGMQ